MFCDNISTVTLSRWCAVSSLSGTQAEVMSDNYGFVSQLQAVEFYLDTSARLCCDSIAAAHKVFFIKFQDVKAIDYSRVCMLDCYSQGVHSYYAIRKLDPYYVNSVILNV